MLKETYLEGKFIKERSIDLFIFEDRINNFIVDGEFTSAKVIAVSYVKRGVSFTFNTSFDISKLRVLNLENRCIVIEFEEFRNAITINEEADVYLDFMHNRILFKDFGISLYFNKGEEK